MARDLTAGMISAVQGETIRPILLAKVATTGGDVRAWTGVGDLTFNSEVYVGTGLLGAISDIQESSDLQANGVTFTLSGIPSTMISLALNQVRQGMNAQIWFGALDLTTGALVSAPYELFTGFTDVPSIDEGGETASISVTAENRLIDLNRARARRYTGEDQAITYPADLGFEFVPALQDREIIWGRNSGELTGVSPVVVEAESWG